MPKATQNTQKKTKAKFTTVKFDTEDLPSQGPPSKKFKSLSTFAKPVFNVADSTSQPPSSLRTDVKGKGKLGKQVPQDDRLWVDIYEPSTEAELAVHKKKVDDVRRWFVEALEGGPSGKLKKYRRILALTGPAGTAKTTTIRVLARELDFEIMEWRNTIGENFSRNDDYGSTSVEHETIMDKFETFLARAFTCHNIFALTSSVRSPSSQSQCSSSTMTTSTRRQVILLEDLPNILHTQTQERFHAALHSLVGSELPGAPVVIVVSDTGLRGELADERLDQGGGRWGKEIVDIRSVLPSSLLTGPYVTQIGFNPIAPTLMRKALQALISAHFSCANSGLSRKISPPSKNVLDVIVESANGDIRSAVMALQFACVVELPGGKGRRRGGDARTVLEAVTRREQSLALFHLMGKVLYNKRKGDPPSASASAKDVSREKELDTLLDDAPALPSFLSEHERRTSRVDVDMLYADSPIDSSLFSLYIQQNYVQFCDDIDQCADVADWLSWVDCSGGETWHQANPHRFHLLTLGTLHSLPSPVTRRGQKMFKPAFFDVLQRTREADDAVRDVGSWLSEQTIGVVGSQSDTGRWRVGGWSKETIATELGGVLSAGDRMRSSAPRDANSAAAPEIHGLFSNLVFSRDTGTDVQLDERDDSGRVPYEEEEPITSAGALSMERHSGGWLESDDIDEF